METWVFSEQDMALIKPAMSDKIIVFENISWKEF